MTARTTSGSDAGDARPFRLIAVENRVLAQNEDGKLIELGQLMRDDHQGWLARLDVGDIEAGPLHDAQAVLNALVPLLTFDYLDGLFTAEAHIEVSAPISGCPQTHFTLKEPAPHGLQAGETPHRF
ncbi:hypothetical protein BJG93_31525 (plasmid) [Paraburkholderia sprentiae WSM5005]|uniref:Uncharacterized protein n=1 Tax=Paraburkholderia sprentiae WSM5005 TaxID=754502 RepID=A0A1I9YUS7_9BURK|nr:hypothetical protein [Paraburkholderia sprentiae]APA89962.2 hypothetical protein BJG93_31525 [Paraburkholderia sprentiae WSM5005]